MRVTHSVELNFFRAAFLLRTSRHERAVPHSYSCKTVTVLPDRAIGDLASLAVALANIGL